MVSSLIIWTPLAGCFICQYSFRGPGAQAGFCSYIVLFFPARGARPAPECPPRGAEANGGQERVPGCSTVPMSSPASTFRMFSGSLRPNTLTKGTLFSAHSEKAALSITFRPLAWASS